MTDVRVTVTDSDYPSAGPSAAEVRNTVALVIGEAVSRAGTVVCEPVDRFQIETPDGTVSHVLGVLARHRGAPEALETARGITVVTGSVPTADTRAVRTGLHTAAHGEAVMESALDHYAPSRGR